MFPVRWRWNLNRALTVLRFKGGRKNPAPIQRLESDDVMAAVFPALVACQENATGPIEIPDHPLVRQTMHDCLHEAMDVDSLRVLVERMELGQVTVTCRDTTEPSVLAHEILSGRPYTFLDDAPLEERRSRAISLRRGLPVDPHDLSALDPDAIARVRDEAAADPRDADELHDLLLSLVVMRPRDEWRDHFAELAARNRVCTAISGGDVVWCATECASAVHALLPDARFEPAAGAAASEAADGDAAAATALRGHLDVRGPMTAPELAALTALPDTTVAIAL